MPTDEIEVHHVAQVRTMTADEMPGYALLKFTETDGREHLFALRVEFLAGLAKQLTADAVLLGAQGGGNA